MRCGEVFSGFGAPGQLFWTGLSDDVWGQLNPRMNANQRSSRFALSISSCICRITVM